MTLALRAGLGLLLVLGAPPRAAAQGWAVELSAGGAEHRAVAAEVDTRSAMLGIARAGTSWLYLAAGAPLDPEGLPWGGGGAGTRLSARLAGIGVGADLSLHGYAYRDPVLDASGGAATVEALPFVELWRGAARLELSSGVQHHRGGLGGSEPVRQTVHRSAALLSVDAVPGVRLVGDARVARTGGEAYPFLGGAAEVRRGRLELRAALGRWMDDAMSGSTWSVDASARVTGRIRVRAAVARHSEDPLYWNPGRRSWTLGVSRAFGGAADPPPPLAVAPAPEGGAVVLRLPLEEAAEPPQVGGDFNGWRPVSMTRQGDAWAVSLALAPGVYRYAFRRADGSWFVPESVPNRVDDGFGGHSAVLIVSGAPGS